MAKIGKSLGLMLLLIFSTSLVVLPQNVRASPEPTITINATEITDTSITLYWTSDQPSSGFVPFNGEPFFGNYILRMSNKTLDSQLPYNHSNYEDVWNTTDSQQTTTTVANLSSSTTYYFYILAGDYLGGAFSNIVEVQTLPSPTSSPTIVPTPTSTSTVPEFPTLIILPLFAVATILPIVLTKRKKAKSKKLNFLHFVF